MSNIITASSSLLGSILSNATISSQKNQYSSLINLTNNSHVKTHQIYEIEKDLLSLSVCWRRLREAKDPGSSTYIGSLLEAELFRRVNDSDIELANAIRDYYSKKLMMWALTSDRNLTPFRKDLSTFISSDGKIFREEILPLVFRLPEFYEYDLFMDKIIATYKEKTNTLKSYQYLFLGRINRTIRKNKKIEFWFMGKQNTLCRLSLDHNNILIPVLENILDSAVDQIFVSHGKLQKRMRDDMTYFEFTTLA